jgi:uncharacterized protein
MKWMLVALIAMLAACSGQNEKTEKRTATLKPVDWESQLIRYRRQKDSFLMLHPESPFRLSGQPYAPLTYFLPDSQFRIEAILERNTAKPEVKIATSTGEVRDMKTAGVLRFKLRDRDFLLTVYELEGMNERFFLPFADLTNGKETYKAGRYIDVTDRGGSTIILDFNEAYHPYCAYAPDYSCPLVPESNQLDIAIRAGEKLTQTIP